MSRSRTFSIPSSARPFAFCSPTPFRRVTGISVSSTSRFVTRPTYGGRVTARLIATDLDGTIVRSDGEISTRTRDALAAAEDAGVVVVFVTGRPPRWMQTISEETGHRGLAVCANGAIVYDLHTETVVQEFPMDIDVARGIAEAIREAVPEVAFAVEAGDRFGHEPHYRSKYELPPDVIVAQLDELIDRP